MIAPCDWCPAPHTHRTRDRDSAGVHYSCDAHVSRLESYVRFVNGARRKEGARLVRVLALGGAAYVPGLSGWLHVLRGPRQVDGSVRWLGYESRTERDRARTAGVDGTDPLVIVDDVERVGGRLRWTPVRGTDADCARLARLVVAYMEDPWAT